MQLKTSSPDRQPQGNKSTWRHRSQLLTRFLLCSPTSLAPPPTARLRRWQRADSGRDPARRPPLRRAQAAALRDRARPPPPSAANSDTAGRGPQRGPEGGTRSSAAGHGAAAGPLHPPAFCLGPAPTARPGLGSRPGPDPGRPLSARPLAAPPHPRRLTRRAGPARAAPPPPAAASAGRADVTSGAEQGRPRHRDAADREEPQPAPPLEGRARVTPWRRAAAPRLRGAAMATGPGALPHRCFGGFGVPTERRLQENKAPWKKCP